MSRASFRARVLAVILGSSAAASLAITLAMSFAGRTVLRDGYAERSLVQARIVASGIAAPMAFEMPIEAAETLEELVAIGGVRRAWVLDAAGQPFVAWSAEDGVAPGPRPEDGPRGTATRFAGDRLLAGATVTADGEELGQVLLDVDLAPIAGQLAEQARMALSVLAMVLAVTAVLALQLQRRLTRPISDLVDLTRRIRGNEDPSARATPSTIPEIGVLAESLNAMLDQLDERGRDLADANERLEERVRARTDELRQAIGRMESEILVREQVEGDLREASRRAEAANAAKSAFLANMSHEIRTPMTAILGFADLLLDPHCDESTCRDAAETIRRNGHHLISIINDILDISKIEAGRMQIERLDVDLPEVLQDVAELMQIRADGKGIGLDVIPRGSLPVMVETDPVRLRQILVNLVGNAIKFTETGGVQVEVSFDADTAMLQLAVRDSGIGIDAEAADRLFKPFAQADDSMTRRFGGTGLGLVISRRLAELLGGDIELESTPGSGSVFTVSVAVGAAATARQIDAAAFSARMLGEDAGGETAAAPEAAPEAAPAPATGHPTQGPLDGLVILLVEDGPDNRRLISHHLTRAGATVHMREDGLAGVEAVTGPDPVVPDLILMDMQMPIMDGYAASARLRELEWRGPIVALTAHAMEGDRDRCLAAGCDEYLTKPVDRQRLIDVIRGLLAVRRAA